MSEQRNPARCAARWRNGYGEGLVCTLPRGHGGAHGTVDDNGMPSMLVEILRALSRRGRPCSTEVLREAVAKSIGRSVGLEDLEGVLLGASFKELVGGTAGETGSRWFLRGLGEDFLDRVDSKTRSERAGLPELDPSREAICPGCGDRYLVPNAGRCLQCGSERRLEPEPAWTPKASSLYAQPLPRCGEPVEGLRCALWIGHPGKCDHGAHGAWREPEKPHAPHAPSAYLLEGIRLERAAADARARAAADDAARAVWPDAKVLEVDEVHLGAEPAGAWRLTNQRTPIVRLLEAVGRPSWVFGVLVALAGVLAAFGVVAGGPLARWLLFALAFVCALLVAAAMAARHRASRSVEPHCEPGEALKPKAGPR